MRGRAGLLLAGLGLATFAAVATVPSAQADGPAGEINAQVESFAMRVEYDIPLPVGTGTIAHVNGEARRSSAGENVHGMAAAPTELDAVVGGRYIDPQQTGHAVNRPPQSECFYPGTLLSTHFAFPTDTQSGTQPLPATSYSTAQCSAGPDLELHATDAQIPANALLDAGMVAAEGTAKPDKNVLLSSTEARASGVSILGGVLKVGSVLARGHSETTGKAGEAHSRAEVLLTDVATSAGRFSVSTATVDGKPVTNITVAGTTSSIDSPYAQSVLDAANAALKPQGCTLSVLTTPASYPQGYLFARPDPEIGVKADGTHAASYRGGLLVVCTLPRSVSDPTTFSPQRMQVLLGFAFTSTTAHAEIGGFNLGDLGGLVGGGPVHTDPVTFSGSTGSAPSVSSPLALPAPDTTPVAPASTAPAAAPARPPVAAPVTSPAVAFPPLRMDQGMRILLGLVCLVVWGGLTHIGARRFLTATTDGDE